MKRIDAGSSGGQRTAPAVPWSRLGLPDEWASICEVLAGVGTARPLQVQGLRNGGLLASRRNVIISAPTNSGKTLLGTLVLLDAVRGGGRAVLLEPLRALARERADHYRTVLPGIARILGREVTVRVTTGDVRLDSEELAAPPPADGQLVIATPERLDAIMRNPSHEPWISSVRAVCVDEAHLLGDAHRGPALELVVTSFLTLPAPPRVVLLSATMGSLDEAARWLAPCDVIDVRDRPSKLTKTVVALGDSEANQAVTVIVREALADPEASVLVFVYQTASAASLARHLTGELGALAGEVGALPYHSQMPSAVRDRTRQAFEQGAARVVVATTALAMGVNLPASHVVIRDVTFFGEGALEVGELLQMMGRAGRGDRPGHATVIVRDTDRWKPKELADALREEQLAPLRSSFSGQTVGRGEAGEPPVARVVSALLARREDVGMAEEELANVLSRSLGAHELVSEIAPALGWLADSSRLLSWRTEEDRYRLTSLGLAASRSALPLDFAAGYARLIRDLLSLERAPEFIGRWNALDHLTVMELLWNRQPSLRPFNDDLVEGVDGWMEQHSADVPVLYREWIRGAEGCSKADEVIGSLGALLKTEKRVARTEQARREGYSATLRAILLLERSRGVDVADLERRWSLKPEKLAGIEERWRDTSLWLLAGVARLLDVRTFRYHLKVECLADAERMTETRDVLKRLRRELYDLMSDLQHCSPLGVLLRGKRTGIGVRTVRQLEGSGIRSIAELANLREVDLLKLGIRKRAANAVVQAVRRRAV